MMNDTVSVIIPTYNCATWLAECLQSVLDQSRPPDEIIVIDDGSSDDTEPVIDRFKSEIIFIRQENQGQSVARNNGVAISSGKWLAFMDADDIWFPHKLEKQLDYLKQNPHFSMVASDMTEGVNLDSETTSLFSKFADIHEGKIFRRLLRSSYIFPSTVVIRKSVYDKFGGFDPSLQMMEDLDLFMKVARDYEIGIIQERHAFRRRHLTSISKNEHALLKKAAFWDSAENRFGPFTDEERKLAQKQWLQAMFAAGYECLLLGKRNLARDCFRTCLSRRYMIVKSIRCTVSSFLPHALFMKLHS